MTVRGAAGEGELVDAVSWVLGLSLVVVTIAMHTTGIVAMAFAGVRVRGRAEGRQLPTARVILLVASHLGVVACALTALHGLEAALWAAGYVWLDAFGSYKDALFFSNSAMTAFEVHVELPTRWQILGSVEAVNATLLFGISTAFIFAMLNEYWPQLAYRRS